ncbi:uncharacterized protein LOC142540337 [Primulina tabacum]|uniref:uncharacterized protein LOC142540337 n=1 Tax=Primulina tabacum TaxID=48773 RepID=UPI003F59E4BC
MPMSQSISHMVFLGIKYLLDVILQVKIFLHGNKLLLNHDHLGKIYSCDQTNVSEPDVTLMSAWYVDENAKVSEENQLIEEYCATFSKNSGSCCLDKPSENCCSIAKSNQDSWLQELESIADESFERVPMSKDLKESWHSNANLMYLDESIADESFERVPMSKDLNESWHSNANLMYLDRERPEKNCSDLDSQWSEFMKIEPWWHSADKDDIASFISRRSSSHIRTRDLPEPQALHFEKGPDNFVSCFDQVKNKWQIQRRRFCVWPTVLKEKMQD